MKIMYPDQDRILHGRRRSMGLAHLGAIFTWSSSGVLLLTMIIFFSYSIGSAGAGLHENDLTHYSGNEWRGKIHVSGLGTLTGTVKSRVNSFPVQVIIYDPNGNVLDTYRKTTPLAFSTQVFESGTYEISLKILEQEKTVKDLDITISSSGFDILYVCCGLSFFVLIFIGLLVAGFVLLVVAANVRWKEFHSPVPPIEHFPVFHSYENNGDHYDPFDLIDSHNFPEGYLVYEGSESQGEWDKGSKGGDGSW